MLRSSYSFLKGMVICHGKSEKLICDFIKSNLRLHIEIDSDKKGKKSIQITSIMKFLSGEKYKDIASFKKKFDDIEQIKDKKKLPSYFKIFIIMDTDDCNENQKKSFKDKSMFKEHWLYDYIVPIYNDGNLEEVFVDMGIKFEKSGDERKKEYPDVLMKNGIFANIEGIKKLKNLLKNSKKTNMEEFINFCLELIEK
ncbi:hypothetical protein [Fusobacterium polymorphum]|uniref:hypothetical protein n=1 Tax=Fusobacterium nucleatum subsp. polymorphum TaxID=76857 RepID=UPI00300ACC58